MIMCKKLYKMNIPKHVGQLYNILCVSGFLAAIIFCFVCFKENNDICLVDLKEYNGHPDNIYPSISIMIVNPFLDDKLKTMGEGINAVNYSKFLAGKLWDPRMLDIDYDNVTIDLNEYFLGYEMFGDNFSIITIDNFTNDPATSYGWRRPYKNFRSAGWQTYAIDPPFNTYGAVTRFLVQASVKIRTDVFKNSIRPASYDYDQDSPTWGGFEVWFHYPNQLMEAWHMGMGKWFWPKKGPLSSRNYAMIFERSKMDVLERRNKKNSPCIEDWKNHDQYVMENLISAAGCRPPHWTSKKDVRICNSQEEMLKVLPPLKKHELLDFVPPCRSITNIPFSYSETEDHGMHSREYFKITMTCADPSFKNIVQVREYSVQNLIGNTGGYLGLILGCSIINLPFFLHRIYRKFSTIRINKNPVLPFFIALDSEKPIVYQVNKRQAIENIN